VPEFGMDSKLWNLEYGIYGIYVKNGICKMENVNGICNFIKCPILQ
jgi:hypothetical protein